MLCVNFSCDLYYCFFVLRRTLTQVQIYAGAGDELVDGRGEESDSEDEDKTGQRKSQLQLDSWLTFSVDAEVGKAANLLKSMHAHTNMYRWTHTYACIGVGYMFVHVSV